MEGSDGPPPPGSPEVRQRAYTAAITQAGTLASPPLAGFAFALIVLILQEPESFAHPDAALALLTGAGLFLILAVQSAIATERVGANRPDADQLAQEELEQGEALREATRFAYNIGLALFFAGVTAALVPTGEASVGRWIAIAIAGLGCLRETRWVIEALTTLHQDRFQLLQIWLGVAQFSEPRRDVAGVQVQAISAPPPPPGASNPAP